MRKPELFTIFLGFLLVIALTPAPAHAEAVVVGVNLDIGPDQLTLQEQETILDDMKNAGVRVIRTGIFNNDKNVDFVVRVYARGMKVLGIAGVQDASGNMILSAADPEKFRAYFQPFLARLESKGIVLAGIELGNEINWSNHDLGAIGSGSGRIFGINDLLHDPKGQLVARGFVNYVKVLAALKDIRDHSQLNKHTAIISAGAGDVGPGIKGRDAVSIKAMIQFLRDNGMDKLVDAYGIHWYPEGNATPAARLSDLQNNLSVCGSAGNGGKPCWLTEWGLPVHSGKSCSVNDDNRVRIFSEIKTDFSQFAGQGRLEGVFLYTWQGGMINHREDPNPYGAFICGSLTKSGRLAVSPM